MLVMVLVKASPAFCADEEYRKNKAQIISSIRGRCWPFREAYQAHLSVSFTP
jgi:hypothetical protein